MAKITRVKVKDFLINKQIYDPIDDCLIDQLCTASKRMDDANKALKKNKSDYIESASGELKPHPAISVYNSAFKNYTDLCRKLGLSPSDRQTLGTSQNKSSSSIEDDD